MSSSSRKAAAFIALASISSVLCLSGLYRLAETYDDALSNIKPEDTVFVMMANRDLYQGIPISEEDLYAVRLPPRFLPDGVFLNPDTLIGRIPRERVLQNEFIRGDRLANPETGTGLHALIPKHLRAMSIELNEDALLSGHLQPGHVVDLISTTQLDDGVVRTKTLEQSIFVLGVNSRMEAEGSEQVKRRGKQAPSVTLLVTPSQAEHIALSQQTSELRLSLRNSMDLVDVLGMEDVTHLFERYTPPIIADARNMNAPAAPNICKVVEFRGNQRTDSEFDAADCIDPSATQNPNNQNGDQDTP